jgi:hypothetical protein
MRTQVPQSVVTTTNKEAELEKNAATLKIMTKTSDEMKAEVAKVREAQRWA